MTDRDPNDQPQPDATLKRLGRLVGTWQVSGEAHGTVTYEWMEGGFFLIQHIDLGQAKALIAEFVAGGGDPDACQVPTSRPRRLSAASGWAGWG